MAVPEGYLDALIDELAPFGFEYLATETATGVDDGDEGDVAIRFGADPLPFAHRYPDAGSILENAAAEDEWPPHTLDLWIRIDRHSDPESVELDLVDLLAWSASEAPDLHDRLNTLHDPADHAVAVGEALARYLDSPGEVADDYFS